jgi:hypothetical protein
MVKNEKYDEQYVDAIVRARILAHEQISDLRLRAIITRYLEDAICWAEAGGSLPALRPTPGASEVR